MAELNRLAVPPGEVPNRLVVSHVVPQVVAESNRLAVPQDEETVLARSPLVVLLGEVPLVAEPNRLVVLLVPEWTPEQQVEPAEQRTLGSVPQEPGLSE